MATSQKNLSEYKPADVPGAKNMRFAIVISQWNPEITNALAQGAYNFLIKQGASEKDITVKHVPGSYELTFGAKICAEEDKYDAVICLGCVIQGETKHFDYICQSVSYGLTELNLSYDIPFIFGVLTTNTLQQAKDRAGGKHGNKGDEAAYTAIKMVALNQEQ